MLRSNNHTASAQVAPRPRWHVLTIACATLLSLAAFTAPALAVEGHVFSQMFGKEVNETTKTGVCPELSTNKCKTGVSGEGSGQFHAPEAIAVNQATGDVYVGDVENYRVQEIGPTGSFILMFGKEVNETKDKTVGASEAEKNICTAASGNTCKKGVKGIGTSEFKVIGRGGVAVDNSSSLTDPSIGDVYVVDHEGDDVQKFTSSGEYISKLEGVTLTEPTGVAVNQVTGEVLVASGKSTSGVVDRFSPEGHYTGQTPVAGLQTYGLAVNTLGGIYDAISSELHEYSPSGTLEAENFDTSGGLTRYDAVNGENDVFASDAGSEPSNIYVAEYGATGTPISEFGPGVMEAPPAVAVDYATGSVYVAEQTKNRIAIYTKASVPYVSAESGASVVGSHGAAAKLTGSVNPEGVEAKYQVEYGATLAYGAKTAEASAGASGSAVAVAPEVTGVVPDTTYDYRLVARNANGANYSGAKSFTTGLAVEGVETKAASGISASQTLLNGSLEPTGAKVDYWFEYGEAACGVSSCGTKIPLTPGETSAASGRVAVSQAVTGLHSATLYHYRLVAENTEATANKIVYSAETTFETGAAVREVSTGEATSVTPTVATLAGSLTPNSEAEAYYETEYWFEWGACTSNQVADCAGSAFSERTATHTYTTVEVKDNPAARTVAPARVTGLHEGSRYNVYHFRLVAHNALGTTYGKEAAFTTPPAFWDVGTGAPEDVTRSGATAIGEVSAFDGGATTYAFEYGPCATPATCSSSSFPSRTSEAAVPAEEAVEHPVAVAVTSALATLAANTPYHYRLVAKNSYGTVVASSEETFTTGPEAPVVVSEKTSTPTASSVTLEGSLNPGDSAATAYPTSYHFEYWIAGGEEAQAESYIPAGETTGNGTITIATETIQGLDPGTEYDYRLIAENISGGTEGLAQTFTTETAPSTVEPPAEVKQTPTAITLPFTQPLTPALVSFTPASIIEPSVTTTTTTTSKTKSLTKAQKLAKALKQCEQDKGKAKRMNCEKAARKKWGTQPKTKKKKA